MASSTPTSQMPVKRTIRREERDRLNLPRWFPTFHKHVTNRVTLRRAGGPHSANAIVHHVGRHSGRAYATPIVPYSVNGGFLIALPYGPGVDWLRNLQAAGRATITYRGATYMVGSPEVLTEEQALPLLSPEAERKMRRLHVPRYARLKVLSEQAVAR